MREERIGPEGSFRCELRSLSGERLKRLPAEAVGARLGDALRHTACRRRPRELLVVCGERGAAVLALLLAAEEGVRYVAEQRGADAGEEEAFHGSPGCRGRLMRGCSDGAVQFAVAGGLAASWMATGPRAALMPQTSGRIMRGRDASEDNWWRQPAARIEAVEAVEAIEKLF